MLKGHAFIVSLFLFGTVLSAAPHLTRNYACRYFSTRDGLAQMQVICAHQDKDGYIWFGTKGGLSRWDGETFKNYTPDDNFPGGEVHSISSWGNIIVASVSGHIALIYPDGHLDVAKLPKGYEGFAQFSILDDKNLLIYSIFKTNDQRLVYSFQYNRSTKMFKSLVGFNADVQTIHGDTVISNDGVYLQKGLKLKKIITFAKNAVFLRANNSNGNILIKFDKSSTYYKYHLHRGKIQLLWKKWFDDHNKTFLFEDNLIGSNRLLVNQSDTNILLGNKITTPSFVLRDREHNLWIGTDNGIYNFYGLNIIEYRFGLGEPDNVWSIVEDKNNNMWLGCYTNGLLKLHPDNTISFPQTNFSNSVFQYMGSTINQAGDLYMNYANGWVQYHNDQLVRRMQYGTSLYCFYDEKNHDVFSSGMDTTTSRRGLVWIHEDQRTFIPWNKGYPITIIKDARNRIRIGGFRGQAILKAGQLETDTLPRNYQSVICMTLDTNGILWKGTEKGIYAETLNGKEYHVAGNRLVGTVLSMKIWRNKYLITGTQKSIIIVPLTQHRSWHDYEFTEIGYDAGFTGLESGQNGMCIDHNGDVWLSTALCVLKFNPEKLMQWQHQKIPPIRVSHISYSTDNTIWKAYYPESKPKNPFVFDDEYKFFRIEYICNSISAPHSLRFRYRLVGMSEKWSESVNTKSVSYTNLLPGKYTFEVECSMDGEHWSKPASSPEFIVLAPHLLRWYMLVLYFIALVSTIVFISRWIIKRKEARKLDTLTRKKLENELQLNTLRSKVIPHFTKNVLSAIGHFAMTDKLRASHYIAVFSKFTQLTLSNADKNYNSLEEEINYLRTYLELEKMRFDARFDYKISIEQHVNTAILIPGMTLHTYCDNAIRHGLVNKKGSGFLSISITNHHNGVLIVVEDNGIGRERAQQLGTRGNGQGLLLIEQQLQFYNSQNSEAIFQTITDLNDENNMPSGTRVNLYIPKNYRFE